MKAFLDNPNLLKDEFYKMLVIAQVKAFVTIDIEIQKNEIVTISNYRQELNELKSEYVKRSLENEANLVYCIETMLHTIQYELEMLVNIKEDRMSDAWDNLINAQLRIGNVIANRPNDLEIPENYVERLKNYEHLLFPKQYFQSVGGIVEDSHCSICNSNFDECEHVRGKLYMGELCCRVITQMKIEEVSLVENPANKHCRIIAMEIGGKMIDILTLREQKEPSEKQNN